MNLTNYIKAGYGCICVETTEIKRAAKSIQIDEPFQKLQWNLVTGIKGIDGSDEPAEILNKAMGMERTAIILENYTEFFENIMIQQTFLNNYEELTSKQVMLVIVSFDITKIPTVLKELVPIIQFDLPSKDEIKEIATDIAEVAQESFEDIPVAERKKLNLTKPDTEVTDEIIEACCGMSYEEIANVLALSMIEKRCFDIRTILDRKRQTIRATGFMDFLHPEPIENLGGLVNLKEYVIKRMAAFEHGSNKPKLRSILLVGFSGCGKSLGVKAITSLFDWPGIILDVGSLKGGLVGDTEKNTRIACKTIDAFGKCVVCLDEIEKAFAGSKGSHDSGVSAGMMGYFLTWMQERESEGIIIATANDLNALPPEFLRAGRWDTIFFVDLPNQDEIKEIIEIMNRRYESNLPTDIKFCTTLHNEGWTGSEIEQLAKDSHFDEIEIAKKMVPLLSVHRKDSMEAVRSKAAQYRKANGEIKFNKTAKPTRRRLSTG